MEGGKEGGGRRVEAGRFTAIVRIYILMRTNCYDIAGKRKKPRKKK